MAQQVLHFALLPDFVFQLFLLVLCIGAPLGAIIKKGGIGLPLVFAIFFFLLFHLLMIFGKNFAVEGTLPPFLGMWLPVIALSPIGMFLTYKAMNDSALFNKEYYIAVLKKITLRHNDKKKLSIGA